MTVPSSVRIVDDSAELEAFFSDVPAAHIYALADLEPPFWEPSTWYRRGEAVVGFVRLPDTGATTIYSVATHDASATVQLLVDLQHLIDPGMLITGPVGVEAALRSHREFAWHGRYLRYVLDDVETALAHMGSAEPIDPPAVVEIQSFYDSEPGAAFFLPHMLDYHSYVGVYDGGELVSAAGTHVLSEQKRCAAIGSVYTRPSHRGQGLGRIATAGVVARIADRVDLIGLNVAADNAPARAIYERLGFRPVLEYTEAELAP